MTHFTRRNPQTFDMGDTVASFLSQYEYSPTDNAARYYRGQLKPFLAHFKGRALDSLTAEDLRAYLGREQKATFVIVTPAGAKSAKRQHSQGTVIHRYQALRTFFNWCVDEGKLGENPMGRGGNARGGVRRPKGEFRIKRGFTQDEVARLLRVSGSGAGWLKSRDRAVVIFLLGTAARISELLELEDRDIDWNGRRVTLHGKGSKDRTVRLGPNVAKALRAWIAARPKDAQSFWVTTRRTPMGYKAVQKMLENLGKYADVDDVQPHRFRHTAATEYTRVHRDPRATQILLGHIKPETTARYLARLDADHYINANYSTPDEWLG